MSTPTAHRHHWPLANEARYLGPHEGTEPMDVTIVMRHKGGQHRLPLAKMFRQMPQARLLLATAQEQKSYIPSRAARAHRPTRLTPSRMVTVPLRAEPSAQQAQQVPLARLPWVTKQVALGPARLRQVFSRVQPVWLPWRLEPTQMHSAQARLPWVRAQELPVAARSQQVCLRLQPAKALSQ